MSVAANFRITLSPRTHASRARERRPMRLVHAADTAAEAPAGAATAPPATGRETVLRTGSAPGHGTGYGAGYRPGYRPVRRVAGGRADHPTRLAAAAPRTVTRACAPRPAAGSIGWLVVVGVLAALVVLATGWVFAGPDAAPVPDKTVVVQVHPGETLWTVAKRLAPTAESTAVVDRIRQLNELSDDSVFPGELLQVPSTLSDTAAAAAGAIQP